MDRVVFSLLPEIRWNKWGSARTNNRGQLLLNWEISTCQKLWSLVVGRLPILFWTHFFRWILSHPEFNVMYWVVASKELESLPVSIIQVLFDILRIFSITIIFHSKYFKHITTILPLSIKKISWIFPCPLRRSQVTVHHLASDDYVRQEATFWLQQLRPDVSVYVEHSNEVWNPLWPGVMSS